MSHSARQRLYLIPIVAALGCGGGGTPAASAPRTGPHGGVLAEIPPGGPGFVEILAETGDDGKARLVAYFLGGDATTPASPAPATASIALMLPDGTSPTTDLKPDAAAPDRLVSAAGPYELDQLFGEITATVDGQAVTVPFARAQ